MKRIINACGMMFCLVGCLLAAGGSLAHHTHVLASGLLLVVASLPVMIPATMSGTIAKLEERISALEENSGEKKDSEQPGA